MTENTAEEIKKAYRHCAGIFAMYNEKGMCFRIIFTDIRRFGKSEVFARNAYIASTAYVAIDPLDTERFTLDHFHSTIRACRRSGLYKILLDQRIISGIGNYLRSEILFDAGISPFRQCNEMSDDDIKILYHSILRVIKKSLDAGGCSILDYRDFYGNKGRFQEYLAVYKKTGMPCLNCGTGIIERSETGGAQRVYACYNCQS